MYVTMHAYYRMTERIGWNIAGALVDMLEGVAGKVGTVAYIVRTLPEVIEAEDGSNGDTVIVVAVDGSVETVYLRRAEQDMSPAYFGALEVVDMRTDDISRHERYAHDGQAVASCPLCISLNEDASTRQEVRAERTRNGRKMHVTGRSTLLLSALSSGQQRRRVSRRKAGGR